MRIPSPGAEFEIRWEPLTFVAHRKYDRVIGATRDANPDGSTLTILIRIFCRVRYQLVGHEADRAVPIALMALMPGSTATSMRQSGTASFRSWQMSLT